MLSIESFIQWEEIIYGAVLGVVSSPLFLCVSLSRWLI